MKDITTYIKESNNDLSPRSSKQLAQIIAERVLSWDGDGVLDLNDIDTSNLDHIMHLAKFMSYTDYEGKSPMKLLTNIDISGWDVSNVTHFMGAFQGFVNLKYVGDLSKWNVTSKCVNFQDMFCGCKSLKELNLAGWDVSSKRATFTRMFKDCSSLKRISLDGWTAYENAPRYEMFDGCDNLVEKPNIKINKEDNPLDKVRGSSDDYRSQKYKDELAAWQKKRGFKETDYKGRPLGESLENEIKEFTGYHVCSLGDADEQSEEQQMANHLYDSLTHNEITVGEAVSQILKFVGDAYPSDKQETVRRDRGTMIFGTDDDGEYCLTYDMYSGIFDVFASSND